MANKTDGEVEKSIISSDMKIKGKITLLEDLSCLEMLWGY